MLIGEHPSIIELRKLVARIAPSQAGTVLIYGETGTGKGLVARMIHELSPRRQRPLVDINCAAIPAELLESELFGHERGAFTGALGKKEGLIEAADGGTVFLDEVRELHPVMQAKILTLLDTKRFRRLGAVKPIDVDVRFIAATNKILLQEVHAGKFRDDLYYRLQVISLNIPPLRERGDDIFLLADGFLRRFHGLHGGALKRLDDEVRQVFRAYRWPGNVRELENLMERICLVEAGEIVRVEQLPARILREVRPAAPPPAPSGAAAEAAGADAGHDADAGPAGAGGAAGDEAGARDYHRATQAFQRRLVARALEQSDGRLGATAERLGLTRHALRYQMLKLGLLDDG